MFKNMYHSHKLVKSHFSESFLLYVYLNRPHKLPKANLEIFSNKILDGIVMNYNFDKLMQKKIDISSLNPDERSQNIFKKNLFKQEIVFPGGQFCGTYKYTFPVITLYPEMTIILTAETSFDPIKFLFTPAYQNISKNDFYEFTIAENLLEK